MKNYRAEFTKYLEEYDKDNCVIFALNGLENRDFTVKELFEEIIGPSFDLIEACKNQDEGCVWKEHLITAIIRTVIESAYIYVIKEKAQPLGKKTVLLCPEKEYHEIGLRIIKDFFILNGYEVIYIGANTPRKQAVYVIRELRPEHIAISVSGHFLLSETKKLIDEIRNNTDYKVNIIVGGKAFKNNMSCVDFIGADMYMGTYDDIKKLKESEE